MRSFRKEKNDRRDVFLNLAGSIEGQLRQAYAKRHAIHGETQTDIANRLGVNKSAITHRLNGQTNMTIETIADMVWALGHCIEVEITDPEDTPSNRARIIPTFEPTPQRAETGSSTAKVYNVIASTSQGSGIRLPTPGVTTHTVTVSKPK